MHNLLSSATVLAGELDVDTDTVTPGVLGFLTIFAIAVGLYFLMRSLLGKLRGLSDAREAEEQATSAGATADTGDGHEQGEADETGAPAAESSEAGAEDPAALRSPRS